MTPLSDDWLQAIYTQIARHNSKLGAPIIDIEAFRQPCFVDFVTQGNFTIAMLCAGDKVYIGVAKRLPTDRHNSKFAAITALLRAAVNPPTSLVAKEFTDQDQYPF